VPRPGGFAYLIYLPNSRHARLGAHNHRAAASTRSGLRVVGADFAQDALDDGARDRQIRFLEAQVEHLSRALSRALRDRQSLAAPPDFAPGGGPYALYRSLTRKRRWWRF